METKVRNMKMERIRVKLGYEGLLIVEPVGKSGGLALLWKNNREVLIQNYFLRHISATMSLLGSDTPWRFIGFYGNPNWALREESWQLLTHLSQYLPHK
jgi:hypothetical protein